MNSFVQPEFQRQLLRFALGIEAAEDIIADITQALAVI
jgi:cystathionine beta-lyase/cystathionine gamma-synthase